MMLNASIAQGSSYAPAIFGLVGSLIGGFIAGTVSLLVARQAREAAEGAWIRDNRREIYDRLLTTGERLLHACEAYKYAYSVRETAQADVESGLTNFFEVYAWCRLLQARDWSKPRAFMHTGCGSWRQPWAR